MVCALGGRQLNKTVEKGGHPIGREEAQGLATQNSQSLDALLPIY